MCRSRRICMVLVALAVTLAAVPLGLNAAEKSPGGATSPYAAWTNGPDKSPDYFPIAVWLQSPANAARYKAIGINTYVGLWQGPTEQQIAELKKNGISVFCSQNQYALKHLDEKTIVGWLQNDEPDNAQAIPGQKGWGPPVLPEKVVGIYEKLRAADPTRPIILNLGQGVAWDGYFGRGVRTNHPEDYSQYAKGADIVSYDIYPAVHETPAIAGNLYYVAHGVKRLREWTKGEKPVWDCIETTHIENGKVRPTPDQVKAEVWMSIIYGSRGLIYFCHEFKPKSIEAGLLAYPDIVKAVGEVNGQIHELAAVINGPAISEVSIKSEPGEVSAELAKLDLKDPIAMTARKKDGTIYVFAVRMENKPAKGTFSGLPAKAKVEVLGENRSMEAADGKFTDEFGPYAVHLYRVTESR